MECYCDYDLGPIEFFRRRRHVARVFHKCSECNRKIWPGETYHYISAKQDGYLWAAKNCAHCMNFRGWASTSFKCWCNYYNGMWEDFGDWLRDSELDMKADCKGLYFETLRRVHDVEKARRIAREQRPPLPFRPVNDTLLARL